MEESQCSGFSIVNGILIKDSVNVATKNNRKYTNAGICSRKKCVKSIESRLPPILQPTLKKEEIWAVKALPSNWAPISKPSAVIENLNKKRREKHDNIINNVKIQFETININIEADIRLRSESFKRDRGEKQEEIKILLTSVDVVPNKMLDMSKEALENLMQSILEIYKKHNSLIEELYAYLKELEKGRAEEYKKILKSAYEDLHKISYELPYELQQFFEHEILSCNQMFLSNLRCYADLQLQLKLQTENSNRLDMQTLDGIKSKWKDVKKRDFLTKLNEKNLLQTDCEALLLNTEQGKRTSESFLTKEHNMQEMWTHLSPLPITSDDVNVWTNHMQATVDGLDSCARKLITLYKMAIIHVFNGYFDELQNITQQMLEMGLVDTADISAVSLDVCKPTIERITREYSNELFNLESLWELVITDLQQNLQSTYKFLNDAAHLWDSHFQRINEAKRIVLKDLQNIIDKNDKATQDQEVRLNVALDILRQAATEEKLEDALDEVYDLLDILKKVYNSHYAIEVKVIQKFKNLNENESNVLLAELSLFLNLHPKGEDISTKQKARESQITILSKTRLLVLPQQMKQCEFQVAAVHNWMFGLWEAIETYRSTCKQEMTEKANVWLSEQTKKLAKRLEVKLAFHTSSYARVKIDVFDVRFAELKSHSERFHRHKAGAEKEILDIRKSFNIYETSYINIIEDYKKRVDKMNMKMENAKTSSTISAYIGDLNYNTSLCNKLLNDLSEKQEQENNYRLLKTQECAVQFSKKIRLFSENGNFHYEEAKNLTKAFKKLEKKLKKKFNAIKREIKSKERKMFQKVFAVENRCLEKLSCSLEEFKFNEITNERIKQLQANVKTEGYNIKLLVTDSERNIKEMETKNMENLGKIEFLEQIEYEFNEIIALMLGIYDYLYQPEPVINASRKRVAALSQPVEKPETPAKKSKSTAEESPPALTNYSILLFDRIPSENNSFMSKICYNLYQSIQTIQNEAKEFYGKHGAIFNHSKVQPNYEEFMKEVFAKYNFYHLQCEMFWLELVNAFIKQISNLQMIIRDYHKSFLQKHYEISSNDFVQKHKVLIETMRESKANHKKSLSEINDKLKTLHGYKNNKHLLDEIRKEMEETIQRIRNDDITNTVLGPYLEHQEEQIGVYEIELNDADKRLTRLRRAFFERLLNLPLVEQFGEKLAHMNDLLSQELDDNDENKPVCGIDKMYSRKIKALEIPSEYQVNFDSTITLLEEENDANITNDNAEQTELLQNIMEEHKKIEDSINEIENYWYEDVDTYEKIFEANIESILKLYVVKYNNS